MSMFWGEPALTAEERLRRFRREQDDSLFMSEEPPEHDASSQSSSTMNLSHRSLQPLKRKRPKKSAHRTGWDEVPPSPSDTIHALPSPSPPPRIKTEAEIQALADLQEKSSDKRVKIYVGQKNTIFEVGLDDLDKSPVLRGWVNLHGTENQFVMHPILTEISAAHFESVGQFLLMEEYVPAIVNSPEGGESEQKMLDGCNTVVQYEAEALRAAHLYVIALRLGIQTMRGLVFRKITCAQYKPYGMECLLDMAFTVFSRFRESTIMGETTAGETTTPDTPDYLKGDLQDELEEWLIETLASKFWRMMESHPRKVFEITQHKICAARELGPRILRCKADKWDAKDGIDVIPTLIDLEKD